MSKYLLVGNPTAQSGKNEERIATALALLEKAGLRAVHLPTLPEGRTVDAVRDAIDADPFEAVIAMGGDGTFREVASGVLSSTSRDRPKLAMLPTGTANDQGKSFGLEATEEALASNIEVIRAGHTTRLDAGVVQVGSVKAHFFDSAGWGLSARTLAQRNADRKAVDELGGPLKAIYRDHAVYVGAFVKTFLESFVVDATFDVSGALDGQPFELTDLTDLIISNTRIYAGAWVLDKTSRSNDGAFELVPFRGKLDWASKAIVDLDGNPITEEMLNAVGVEHSKPFRASCMEMTFRPHSDLAPLAAQIDGEELLVAPVVRVDVIPQAITLMVPKVHAAP